MDGAVLIADSMKELDMNEEFRVRNNAGKNMLCVEITVKTCG